MDSPLFKTQKTESITNVAVFHDRVEYETPTNIVPRDVLKLEDIGEVALMPKPPGSDPTKIDLAFKVSGKPGPVVIQDLDIAEAEEIRRTIRQQKIRKPQEVIEKHPFTLAGRVSKQTQENKPLIKNFSKSSGGLRGQGGFSSSQPFFRRKI